MKNVKSVNRQGYRAKARQKGVSLVSALLGLVVGAFVLKVGYDQYQDSQRRARIDAAVADVTAMISAAQASYGVQNNYAGLDTTAAVKGNIIPARLRVPGAATANNKYNGAITFAVQTITSTSDSVLLTYGNVLKGDCADFIMAVEPLVRKIDIGTNVIKPADGVLDVVKLGTGCDSAANVDVKLVFGRQ